MQRLTEWFWPPPDPKELVRKWQSTLRLEQRALDRQIRDIQFEKKKLEKSIREAAKRGDMGLARSMAKEIVHSKAAINRIATNKAQLMSISNSLVEQMAMLRVASTMNKSTEVMKMVSGLMKLPEMQKTMVEMSKEMMKAGLIDEMMNDALDSALDTEDMEEETDEAVAQVLDEVIGDTMAAMPHAKTKKVEQEEPQAEEEEEDDMGALQARLQAVKS